MNAQVQIMAVPTPADDLAAVRERIAKLDGQVAELERELQGKRDLADAPAVARAERAAMESERRQEERAAAKAVTPDQQDAAIDGVSKRWQPRLTAKDREIERLSVKADIAQAEAAELSGRKSQLDLERQVLGKQELEFEHAVAFEELGAALTRNSALRTQVRESDERAVVAAVRCDALANRYAELYKARPAAMAPVGAEVLKLIRERNGDKRTNRELFDDSADRQASRALLAAERAERQEAERFA
jgi:hypothetical protein